LLHHYNVCSYYQLAAANATPLAPSVVDAEINYLSNSAIIAVPFNGARYLGAHLLNTHIVPPFPSPSRLLMVTLCWPV
jgi:hypothetical protein